MKRLYVVVVEDNDGDVLLFREALAHHQIDCDMHVCSDGLAALEFLERVGTAAEHPCPDLILLDLNLPKVDGVTVLSAFRNHPACAETPVIVVTSSDAKSDRAKVAAYPPTEYFRKPSDFDSFLELGVIVRRAVEGAP